MSTSAAAALPSGAESLSVRRRLALAEEEERRQVARQLHSGAGQQLAVLSLGLQALSDLAAPGSEVDRRAASLRLLVNTTGRELHALAVRLMPNALDEFGLAAAVDAYAHEWSRETGIALELHVRIGATRLARELESAVYRIVQEAFMNVAKHSSAGGVSLVVERRHATLCADIADDGRGFDTSPLLSMDDPPGLGIPCMRARAALAGGTVQVESAPGLGTVISVRLPVTP